MTNVIQLRPTAPSLVPYTGIGQARQIKPRTMAGLIRLHSKQVDVFNSTDHRTDAEFEAHAEATYYMRPCTKCVIPPFGLPRMLSH